MSTSEVRLRGRRVRRWRSAVGSAVPGGCLFLPACGSEEATARRPTTTAPVADAAERRGSAGEDSGVDDDRRRPRSPTMRRGIVSPASAAGCATVRVLLQRRRRHVDVQPAHQLPDLRNQARGHTRRPRRHWLPRQGRCLCDVAGGLGRLLPHGAVARVPSGRRAGSGRLQRGGCVSQSTALPPR